MNIRSAIIVIASLVLFLMVYYQFYQGSVPPKREGLPEGTAAPDFTFIDLSGNSVSLNQFRGHLVFLNFWTTWCPPCREEIPFIQRLYDRLKNEGLIVLTVNVGEDPEVVKRYVNSQAMTFPVLLDTEGETEIPYRITGFPESYIIDPHGIIVRKVFGPENWVSPEMVEFFKRLLNP